MQRTILSLEGYRFELHLAVTIGVDEYPAEATGQEFAPSSGPLAMTSSPANSRTRPPGR